VPAQPPYDGPPRPRPWRLRLQAVLQRGDSAGWLLATLLQGLLTWGFMGLAELARGWPWEREARLAVVAGIVATWVLALRAIHQRVVELARFWRLTRTPARAAPAPDSAPARESRRTAYVKGSILRLRIIAAGITLPFFVLPALTSFLCLVLCWTGAAHRRQLAAAGLALGLAAAVVGFYFHWAVLPAPARRRLRHLPRPARSWAARLTRRWESDGGGL